MQEFSYKKKASRRLMPWRARLAAAAALAGASALLPVAHAQDAVITFTQDMGGIFLGSSETITTTTVSGTGRILDGDADAVENTSAILGEGLAAGSDEAADGDAEGGAAVVADTTGNAADETATLIEATGEAATDTAEDNVATVQQAIDDTADALARLLDAEGIVPDGPGDDLPGQEPGEGSDDPADGGSAGSNDSTRALARACGPLFFREGFPWQDAPDDGETLHAGTGVRQDCLQPESDDRRLSAPLREADLFEQSPSGNPDDTSA